MAGRSATSPPISPVAEPGTLFFQNYANTRDSDAKFKDNVVKTLNAAQDQFKTIIEQNTSTQISLNDKYENLQATITSGHLSLALQITKEIDASLGRLEGRLSRKIDEGISASEGKLSRKIDESISASEDKLSRKIDESVSASEGNLRRSTSESETALEARISALEDLLEAQRIATDVKREKSFSEVTEGIAKILKAVAEQ